MPPLEHVPSASSRLAGLDAARVFATFGIVWVHVAEGHNHGFTWTSLGRFGTSFYIVVAALFVVQGTLKQKPRTFAEELNRRAARLMKPFVVWSLIYGTYYSVLGFGRGATWEGLSQWWGPVAGTAVHLWFLPFAFFWGLFAALVAPKVYRWPLPALALGGALTCAGLYYYCYRHLHFQLNRYWLWEYHLHRLDRWIVEVPPFLTAVWGALVFHRLGDRAKAFFRHRLVSLVVVGLLGFVVVEFLYASRIDAIRNASNTEGRFMGNIAAFFLLSAFLGLQRTRLVRFLAPWGRYTYLAFLVHMLVIEIFRHPVKSLPGYGSLGFSLVESVLVFFASLLVSKLVARTPFLAFLRA